MKDRISALMDGELQAHELQEPLSALREEGDARETWRTYHLISDALRGGATLLADCAPRVAQRLAQEPALVAPLPSAVRPSERARWFVPSALAASVAVAASPAGVCGIAPGTLHARASHARPRPAAARRSRARFMFLELF